MGETLIDMGRRHCWGEVIRDANITLGE